MKKIPVMIAVFCAALSFAQKVSDYQYIALPEKFSGFKENQYKMDLLLAKILKQKQYVVISGNRNEWPAGAVSNPCQVLNADVVDDSSFLRNKIILEFKDCNGNIITRQKGSSSIKDFEEGYPDALSKTFMNIPISKPVENTSIRQDTQVAKETTQETPKVSGQKSQASGAEKYSNGKLSLQKIQIDAAQFILVDGNSSVPFATFRETTKKDVFRVKLGSGESTTGYFENGNLVIEMPEGNDEYSKEVFSAVK